PVGAVADEGRQARFEAFWLVRDVPGPGGPRPPTTPLAGHRPLTLRCPATAGLLPRGTGRRPADLGGLHATARDRAQRRARLGGRRARLGGDRARLGGDRARLAGGRVRLGWDRMPLGEAGAAVAAGRQDPLWLAGDVVDVVPPRPRMRSCHRGSSRRCARRVLRRAWAATCAGTVEADAS